VFSITVDSNAEIQNRLAVKRSENRIPGSTSSTTPTKSNRLFLAPRSTSSKHFREIHPREILRTHRQKARKLETSVGPVPTYYAAVCLELRNHSPNLDLLSWNIGYFCLGERSRQFWFSTPFCFWVRSPYGTNGQARLVMRPIKNALEQCIWLRRLAKATKKAKLDSPHKRWTSDLRRR